MDKESYYFSHDSNARNDLKIVKLRRQLGLEGYGAYWCLIEILRETSEYRLPLSDLDDIAYSINISVEKLKAIVCNYNLFIIEEECFFSARLQRNMLSYNKLKEVRSASGQRAATVRWSKNNNNNSPQNGMVF